MKKSLMQTLWGDLKGEELKKFVILAMGMFLIIGSYWPLKTLKDSIFINLIGARYLPIVKTLSVILCLLLVLFYSRLVESFSKEKMIYIIVTFYFLIGLGFVYFLHHPTIGLSNAVTGPQRFIGWAFYLFVESYIVLTISSFWSFVNDITVPESAKKGYAILTFGTQFGGFLFTLLGNILSQDTANYARNVPIIALISVVMLGCVNFVVFYLTRTISKKELEGYEEHIIHSDEKAKGSTSKVRLLDGIRVILKYPYVAGIFGVLFFQELIGAILGFQLSLLVGATFTDPGMVNKFIFNYSLAIQALTCVFSFVGTSYLMRRLGVTVCLVLFPIFLASLVVCYMIYPTLNVIFYTLILTKTFNYALYTPAKEVLYIPTTRSIKYQSKAWIDMFGLRLAKFVGSGINELTGALVSISGAIVLVIAAAWGVTSALTGKAFKEAVDNNKLIGLEDKNSN